MNDQSISRIFQAVPIADFSFDRSPLLSELFDIFNDFSNDVLQVYLDTLADIRISMMRQLPFYTTPSPENLQFKILLSSIRKIPQQKIYDAIFAASIITNVSPEDIVRLSQISLTKTELDLIQLSLNSIYNSESTIVFRPNGKISIVQTRPYIPETFYFYFKNRDLLFASAPEPINQHGIEKVTPIDLYRDLTTISGYFSDDLSTGSNKRNGLPDVPCYNEIDNNSPVIIKWVPFLKFNRMSSSYQCGCLHDSSSCLTYHQKVMPDGRKTLTYQKDGTINIEDLEDHIPLIFECNENQCLCNLENCPNRVVQKRWKWKLAVVRTRRSFGWSVRTFEFIPKGSFVCELLGRIITSQDEFEAALKIGLDSGKSLYNLDAYHVPVDSMLIIDTLDHGNVTSYMEPSMQPNLVPVSICTGDLLSCHKIAFFAIRNIFPNEELSFHPNYAFNWQKHILELEKTRAEKEKIKEKEKEKDEKREKEKDDKKERKKRKIENDDKLKDDDDIDDGQKKRKKKKEST